MSPRRTAALLLALLLGPGWLGLGVGLGLGSARADSDAAPPSYFHRRNAVVADLGLHVVNAGYQRTLNCTVALQVSAGLYGPWTVNKNVAGLAGGDRDADVVGAVLRARLFVFLRRRAPLGPWLSPFVQGGLVRATVAAGSEQSGSALAGGLAAGWTFRVARRWLLALGLGAQLHRVSVDGSTDAPGFARLGPHVDINVNYTF
ncbi:MAG: hypothetical protein IT370_07115 [Deltaproteobacteria bacterium]|nr:hypothetical protein [Deltaproteobacteria bacterium]